MEITGETDDGGKPRSHTWRKLVTKSLQTIDRKAGLLIALTLVTGCILSIVLFLQTRRGIFFTGDGGMRYLMTEQYAQGKFTLYLIEDQPQWVKKIWQAGLYPFKPPFVYIRNGQHHIVFSFLFNLVSSPFYRLFGFRGLYILPTLALWIMWVRLLVLGNRLKLNKAILWLGLMAMSIGSPMLLYGAIFWEYNLAVLLVFLCVEFVLCVQADSYSPMASAVLGALSGLAVWFRYEAFLVIMPAMIYLYLRSWRKVKPQEAAFIFSAATTIGLMFLVNWRLYGSPLSLQFENISGTFNSYARIWHAYLVFVGLQKRLFVYFPPMIFGLVAYPVLLFSKPKLDTLFLLCMVLLIVFFTPFMLIDAGGKQWGARYYFVMFPAVIVVMMLALDVIHRLARRWLRWGLTTLFVVTLLLSTTRNSVMGSISVSKDYAGRVFPALSFLKISPIHEIGVGNQVIAQELVDLYHSRNFFTISNDDEMAALGQALAEQGIDQFIFLTTPLYYVPPEELDTKDGNGHPLRLTFTSKPLAGDYTLYIGQIQFE